MTSDIDCRNQKFLVCPYCGHEDLDCWELSDSGDTQCDRCQKNFVYDTEAVRYYSSSQADCLNGGEHKWRDVKGVPGDVSGRYCGVCYRREFREVKSDE